MMQAGVRLRQDTETTLPELPKQHRIREKEEELHGLESVHMAESETKCTAPGPNTLEPECVTANSRVSDLHHTDKLSIKTGTDVIPISTGYVIKTESLDFTEQAFATHLHPGTVKKETGKGSYIKTEPWDIKCVSLKSEKEKLECREGSVSDFINTELNGAGVHVKGPIESSSQAGEPNPNGTKPREKKQSELIRNERIHTSEKPCNCYQCRGCLRLKSSLNCHEQIHACKKRFKCNQCEKTFTFKCNLRRHMQTHTGLKPYKCDQCEMRFTRKSNLKGHQGIHTGKEKSYKCDQCAKCFFKRSHLSDHRIIHTGEKPYQCDQCEKSFGLKSHLKTHQKIHTGEKPYKCSQCEKFFGLKAHLKSHQKIHSGEKPYKCDQCERSFFRGTHLKSHLRTHTH
ncbi:hypothetical protein GJAV_G00088160 [Gymnothorax javanicus]|nr:hypothetical protein GJAV_G00088160 [Gymnothorax javanicus]